MREAREWTQEELAENAGFSRTYLAWLKIGDHDPTISTLKKLAKALKVTVGNLVEWAMSTSNERATMRFVAPDGPVFFLGEFCLGFLFLTFVTAFVPSWVAYCIFWAGAGLLGFRWFSDRTNPLPRVLELIPVVGISFLAAVMLVGIAVSVQLRGAIILSRHLHIQKADMLLCCIWDGTQPTESANRGVRQ